MKEPFKPKHSPANRDLRQTEADKTSRLRALRLAKEAQDREAAAQAAAANPPKPARRRRQSVSHDGAARED
jgi:hypothetical protein